MHKWLENNLTLVNVVFIVFCIISYMATVDLLVFSTNSYGGPGNLGGVLHYVWFGRSTVQVAFFGGQRAFSFFDVTSYLLAIIIALNTLCLLCFLKKEKAGDSRVNVLGFTIRNIALAILCLLAYAWEMTSIDASLKSMVPDGGVVSYAYMFGISVIHVYEGHPESSVQWWTWDYALWLLLILLFSTIAAIAKQLSSAKRETS